MKTKKLSFEEMENVLGGGNGDGTAACLNDVYSNHGWISVCVWIESAFIPATVAAFALDCAIHNG